MTTEGEREGGQNCLCSTHHTDAFQLRLSDGATLSLFFILPHTLTKSYINHRNRFVQRCVSGWGDFIQPLLCAVSRWEAPPSRLTSPLLCSSCQLFQSPRLLTSSARAPSLLLDLLFTPCIDHSFIAAALLWSQIMQRGTDIIWWQYLLDLGKYLHRKLVQWPRGDEPVVKTIHHGSPARADTDS